jgi:hypothetical protein
MADKVLYEDTVEKFALGRSTGVQTRNWKSRHMRLTRHAFSYADKAGAKPKLEVPVTAISVLFTNPTPNEHSEAKAGGNFLMVRLHDNGVFNLLVKCPSPEAKQKWIAAFQEALTKSKGSQIV